MLIVVVKESTCKEFRGVSTATHDKEKENTRNSKQVYENGHMYHINSISPNSDQETFLSADDLRINWWHMDRIDTALI